MPKKRFLRQVCCRANAYDLRLIARQRNPPTPWLILSEEAPGAARLRADAVLMAAHWDYELSIKHRILAAGSLRSDDGLTPTGSLLLVGADSRDAAMALIQADPATKAGLRGSITIRYWNAAILDRDVTA
jgi:uncharacterized protein YciI